MTLLEPTYTQLRGDDYTSLASSKTRKWSFNILLLYFFIQPFNNALHNTELIGSILDLMWAVLLSAVTLILIKNEKYKFVRSFELEIVLIWLMYVFFCFAITGVEHEIGLGSPAAYNLRFILQSIPLFMLVFVRGLDRKELNAILLTIVLVTPFAMYNEYRSLDLLSIEDVQAFANSGQGVYYNSYVPYTTFSFFAAFYVFSEAKSILIRLLILCSFSIISVFVFVNPSRQSVIFVIICCLVSIVFTVTSSARNLLLIVIIAAIVAFSIQRLDLVDKVSTRFFSSETLDTTRDTLMARGIDSISGPLEWICEAGMDKSLDDGVNPHNNYIFTTMRTGLIGTVLMFLPFLRAILLLIAGFVKHFRQPWFDRNITVFLMNCMLFVLFHSFFGYPHLDSLSGPMVWFGLAVWVVYRREMQKRVLINRHVPQPVVNLISTV